MTEDETPLDDRKLRVEVSSPTIWQVIGAILITITAIWLIAQARGLVSMLAVWFFFSLALQPGVNRLHRDS